MIQWRPGGQSRQLVKTPEIPEMARSAQGIGAVGRAAVACDQVQENRIRLTFALLASAAALDFDRKTRDAAEGARGSRRWGGGRCTRRRKRVSPVELEPPPWPC